MNWTELETATQFLLDDTNQEFVGQMWLRTLLESAELFATITRGSPEVTTSLFLDPQRTFYRMHDPTQNAGYPYTSFIDIVAPLRVTIAKSALERTTLASVCLANRDWATTYGVPHSWFFVGGTILGFYPIPFQAMVADVTYIRVPPWDQLGESSPYIPRAQHTLLPHYAAAIAFGAEGDMRRAQEELTAFAQGLGLPDPKFKPTAKQRSTEPIDTQVKRTEE